MIKEVWKLSEASRMFNLLHHHGISYTVEYVENDDQREGKIKRWKFDFDPTRLVDAISKEL